MRQAANANSSIVGTAWKTETYVLTLVFLITTILKNAQNKISPWKSSITALLLHALAAKHHKKHAVHERQDEMDAVAKGLEIKLQKPQDGWQPR